jgi:hypothetical protein
MELNLEQIEDKLRAFNDRWCRGRKPTLLQFMDMAKVFGLRLGFSFRPREMVAGDIGVSDHG